MADVKALAESLVNLTVKEEQELADVQMCIRDSLTVFADKSFEFVIKTPPAAVQLMEAAKIQKGSKESNRNKVGKVTWAQVEEIAKDKMADLNCFTLESAMKMVAGTARSMGLNVEGTAPWAN